MTDIIIGGIILAILAAAICYIVKQKKAGVKCVGCPDSGSCSSAHGTKGSGCSCGCHCEE